LRRAVGQQPVQQFDVAAAVLIHGIFHLLPTTHTRTKQQKEEKQEHKLSRTDAKKFVARASRTKETPRRRMARPSRSTIFALVDPTATTPA
jgi:hypothetical protein